MLIEPPRLMYETPPCGPVTWVHSRLYIVVSPMYKSKSWFLYKPCIGHSWPIIHCFSSILLPSLIASLCYILRRFAACMKSIITWPSSNSFNSQNHKNVIRHYRSPRSMFIK
jgi:hypothetical protein